MDLIIQRIEFQNEKIGLSHERDYPIWTGAILQIPEYETNFILITGVLYQNNMKMNITASYAYEQFKDLTISEVREEVKRRILQGFSDKQEFQERFEREVRRRSIQEAKAEGGTILDD